MCLEVCLHVDPNSELLFQRRLESRDERIENGCRDGLVSELLLHTLKLVLNFKPFERLRQRSLHPAKIFGHDSATSRKIRRLTGEFRFGKLKRGTIKLKREKLLSRVLGLEKLFKLARV